MHLTGVTGSLRLALIDVFADETSAPLKVLPHRSHTFRFDADLLGRGELHPDVVAIVSAKSSVDPAEAIGDVTVEVHQTVNGLSVSIGLPSVLAALDEGKLRIRQVLVDTDTAGRAEFTPSSSITTVA